MWLPRRSNGIRTGPDAGSSTRLQDYIRAEQTLRVKAQTVNPREGIPFTFVIPKDARSTAMADLRTEGTVRWILEVKAPLKGLNYYAIFGVEVRARSGAAQPGG